MQTTVSWSGKSNAQWTDRINRMTTESEDTRKYPGRISLIASTPLVNAVARAAMRSQTSINSYCRAALLERLARDGVELEGERQVA
jgi:hypothetical protein